MATITLGTDAATSLTALAFKPGYGLGMAAADIASIANAIKDDKNVDHPRIPTMFSAAGLLFIPNRGVLQVLPGDYVGVDNRGWPILVSAHSIANALWTHS